MFGSMIKEIYTTFAGEGSASAPKFLREASDDPMYRESTEDEAQTSLLRKEQGGNFVIDHGNFDTAVDTERVTSNNGTGIEALATYPLEFTTKLPDDWERGKMLKFKGPHCPIEVEPPKDAEPGMTLKYRLTPHYEFRAEVPPDVRGGEEAMFVRPDGVQIAVQVPEHLKPGDTFEVLPPALMVRCPDGVAPGEQVVFRHEFPGGSEWLRAKVPPGLKPGKYFAARLPLPS